MKKIVAFAILLILTGCFNNDLENNNEVVYNASDFVFDEQNKTLVYEGLGNEFADYEVFLEFTSNDSIQRRIMNPGTTSVEVLTINSDSIVRTFHQAERYYVYNNLDDVNDNEIMLKDPIEVGTKWDVNDGTREITEIGVEIFTDVKTYDAVEVKVVKNDMITLEYYAKDIGLIKSVFNPGPEEITSTLKEITTEPLLVTIDLFYPGEDLINNSNISFETNDAFVNLLENEYKKEFQDVASPLTADTDINNITIVEDVLYIDLSDDFVEETNAGADYEQLTIQSVVNTFGKFYDKNKIILTIDNGPYVSGHFEFDVDEILTPNYE